MPRIVGMAKKKVNSFRRSNIASDNRCGMLLLATGSLPYGDDGAKEFRLMWLSSAGAIIILLLLAVRYSQPRSIYGVTWRFGVLVLSCALITFFFSWEFQEERFLISGGLSP
jgi:hypothetical protein